ncbi:polysaccharide deacetylase family protein [Rhizobium sp. YIM 134829]|uniref:polysaccharide deacetylase family protein n=1 Tax=Rhizobium sp. YIM 134829 TaxID=3390453 RepID=UPI00397960FE
MTSRLKRSVKRAVITAGLETARIAGAAGFGRSARGRGVIFTLHHVRPASRNDFAPNAHLEITPEFLEAAILQLTRDGYRFIALSELPQHLQSSIDERVALFTLDDAYRNTLDHAAPVFARYAVPFTVFVTKGFAERTHSVWWETLAVLLRSSEALTFDFGRGPARLSLRSAAAKQAAFDRFAAFVHGTNEADAVARIDALARSEGIDPLALAEALTLDEAGLAKLAADPLAELGGHTVSHRALGRLSDEAAAVEIDASLDHVARLIGRAPANFAYPYGDAPAVSERTKALLAERQLLAVTTKPGTLDRHCPSEALPRISLNGLYQKPAYVSALASGIPFLGSRRPAAQPAGGTIDQG